MMQRAGCSQLPLERSLWVAPRGGCWELGGGSLGMRMAPLSAVWDPVPSQSCPSGLELWGQRGGAHRMSPPPGRQLALQPEPVVQVQLPPAPALRLQELGPHRPRAEAGLRACVQACVRAGVRGSSETGGRLRVGRGGTNFLKGTYRYFFLL